MTDTTINGTLANDVTAHNARTALSIALDGVAPRRPAVAAEAYRLARLLTAARWRHVFQALEAVHDGALCVVGDETLGIGRLFEAVSVPFTRLPRWNAGVDRAAIVCIGCPQDAQLLDSRRLLDFMHHGGLLVTSDHAAALPAIRGLLPLAGRGAPRRARALRPHSDADALLPAVFMPAGYDRLAPLPDGGPARTLATDALTGEPLVVLVPVGAGALLHAAPHWLQDDPACWTALERRPASSVRAYVALEPRDPDVTVGDIQAAVTLLSLLLEGIAVALGIGAPPCVGPTEVSSYGEHA